LVVGGGGSTDASIGGVAYLRGGCNSSTGYGGDVHVCGGSAVTANQEGTICLCGHMLRIDSENVNAVQIRSHTTCDPYISFHCDDISETRIGYVRGCGTSNAMTICNDGGAFICLGNTTSYLTSCGGMYITTGPSTNMLFRVNSTEFAAIMSANSCVSLRYDNVEKFKTVTDGICLLTNCGFAVDWVATSDCRLKTCIEPISSALSTVSQLCGVCFQLCDDEKHENRIGLIAQDVDKVLPEVVSYQKPDEGDEKYGITDERLGIKYDKLTAVLIEAVKEQQQQITCLQQEINDLKNK